MVSVFLRGFLRVSIFRYDFCTFSWCLVLGWSECTLCLSYTTVQESRHGLFPFPSLDPGNPRKDSHISIGRLMRLPRHYFHNVVHPFSLVQLRRLLLTRNVSRYVRPVRVLLRSNFRLLRKWQYVDVHRPLVRSTRLVPFRILQQHFCQ